ncbi:TIM barrel protein [Horticoccus sp. 23ND18S-11]|uniref:TIM barrel protein n=1 Tax=Horticoccus sp. 23ND18S-11 TaxID=3391832 RepID=UPI0039C9DF27
MRSAITVSLVPESKGGPFVFSQGLPDACEHAAALGFDAVEIFPPSAGAIDVADLTRLLERHRLRVAAVGTGAGWVVRKLTLSHGDAAVRQDARAFVRAIIDLAGRFGAPAIIGSMQGRWDAAVSRDQALAYLGEALNELGDHAAQHGVPLLYEPLNRYETNLVNRLGDTAAWLRTLRTKNVRILADLFHMGIEETDSAAALRAAGAMVGHVHFADSNRHAIGFGQTAVAPIIGALREIGYAGYLSAEVLPLPDAMSAARQTIAAFRQHAGPR